MSIVEVSSLKKSYGNKIALKGISFSIEEGQVYGLLGPNGSGKSTMINILSGLLTFNEGKCTILNLDVNKHKDYIQQRIGVVPQEYSLYDDLKAKENVEFFGRLYGLRGLKLKKMVEESLKLVDLWNDKNIFPREFSGGMKRRLNIACSLVHNPKILIMDEPTASLDPISRDYVIDTVKQLNNNGCTIIYTSHYLEEIEQLCNKAIIINKGLVIAEGSPREIKNIVPNMNKITITIGNANSNILKELNRYIPSQQDIRLLNNVKEQLVLKNTKEIDNYKIEIECKESALVLERVLTYLRQRNIKVLDVEVTKVSLEEVFLKLIPERKNIT